MGLDKLLDPFTWDKYSTRLKDYITDPKCVGILTEERAKAKGLRLASAQEGVFQEGNVLRLFFFVDPENGDVIDAKFQVFGQSALLGVCEAICQISIGKNYDQARRINHQLIDKHLTGKPDQSAFPFETFPHVNLALSALERALEACMDIPLPETYVTPLSQEIEHVDGGYPGFVELTLKQKISVIDQVLTEDIRPYIELDAGGVEILNIINDREVIIAYQGACTSCFSATGATLSYIQQVIQAKVHPDLVVVPDMEGLSF